MELDIQSMNSYDMQSTASYHSGNNSARTIVQANAKDNVKVIIRIRPFNEKEKSSAGGPKKCVTVENESTVILEARPDYKVFNFDFVGDEELEQKTIFDQIAKPIADCCLQGYNGSIFAYGQTGSGKTFTIQGPSVNISGEEKISSTLNKDKQDYEKRGLMPRSFEYIFECIENAKRKASEQNDHFEYLIRCTYLEIYNESIIDLLEPGSYNLHLREDIKKGVYVEGLLEENVQNEHDMMALISRGAKNRHMGSTSMNKESSRSHSVLTTIIETKSMSQSGVWNLKTSRFHIIDLAGSERAKHTNAIGERLKEAGMINKSLSALGNVINSLVDISEGKNRHVHYRDSKLTFLLRDSLGGNSKTVIIANISPSIINSGETLSTLKFAQRAKLIKNKAVINEDSSGTIQLLKSEIIRLKKDLAESEQRQQIITQQCQACKNNTHSGSHTNDSSDDGNLIIEGLAEDLEQFSNGAVSEALKQKYIDSRQEAAKSRKRVIYLESLLSANLSTMTGQQKFYEQEISKSQLLVKKYQQSMETYEKQSSRDKMIIKFREDRIAKLEENLPQTIEDKHKLINEYKKEIALLRESVDHNPQLVKLFTEKAEMQLHLNQLKKELNHSPDSLHAQIKSLTELNESLNEYLKQYCEGSKKDFENEVDRLKQVQTQQAEEFNKSIEELLVKEQQYQEKYGQIQQQWTINAKQQKQKFDVLSKKFQEERQQMEKTHKEQLDQLKVEIEAISMDKNQEESTAQMLKIEIAEKQNEYQTLASQLSDTISVQAIQIQQQIQQEQDLKDQIIECNSQIEELKQQKLEEHNSLLSVIESEKKRNQASYKHAEDQWLKKLKEQEKEMLDAQNEKQIIDQQCSELDNMVTSLTSKQEELQQILLYKDEALLELQSQKKHLEDQLANLQLKLNVERQTSETSIQKLQQKINNMTLSIKVIELQKQELNKELENSQQQNQSQSNKINDLNQQLQSLSDQAQELQFSLKIQIKELEQQKTQLLQQVSDYTNEIVNLKQNIIDTDSQSSEMKSQLQTQIAKLKSEYESHIKLMAQENENKVQLHQVEEQKLNSQIVELNQQIQQLEYNFRQANLKIEEEALTLKLNYEAQINQITEDKEAELSKMNGAQQMKLKELQENHSQEIERLNQQHESELQQSIELYSEKIKQIENANQIRLEENKINHQNEMKSVISKAEQEKQILNQQYEEKVNSLQDQSESQRTQSQVGHSNEIQQLQSAHKKQLQELSIQIQQKIEDLEVHNDKLISEQRSVHEKAIAEQKNQLQAQIDDLQNQYQSKVSEIDELRAISLQNLKAQKQQSSQEMNQRLSEQQQKKEQEISAINNKFNLQLAELNSKIQEWQETLSKVQALHHNEVESLNQKINQKEQNLTQNIQSQDQSISLLNQQINDLQHDANLKIQEHNKAMDDKQHMINILEDDLEVKQKHIQNLTDQVNLLESKINDLNETVSKNEHTRTQQDLIIAQLNEQIRLQSDQQSIHMSSNQQLHAEIEKMASDLDILNDQYSKLENQNQGVEELLNEKQQETSQLRQSLREYQSQLNDQQNLSQKLNGQLNQDEQEIQQLQVKIQELDQVQENLRQQNQDLEEQQLQERSSQEEVLAKKVKELDQLDSEMKQMAYDYQTQIQTLNQSNQDQLLNLKKQHQATILSITSELDQQNLNNENLNKQYLQLKQTSSEQSATIKHNNQAIKSQSTKVITLSTDLENKTTEFNSQQEKWRTSLQESKDKRTNLKKELDKIKKENENMKELVKLKDRQLDDLKGYDELDRGNLDKLKKENKDLRTQVTKREFEMKEVVRTLKFYSEEKSRMEKELEKLHRENDQLIGHKNPSQKIQHHLKIKEENNKLREDNYKLLEDLRKKETMIQKIMKSGGGKDLSAFQTLNSQYDTLESQNLEQVQKEFNGGIAKVIEHIIVQPGLIKMLGLNEENLDRIQQQSSVLKLKNIIDIISLLNNTLISKDRDIKDLMNDKKRLEGKYDILEQEKNLINQQLEFKSNNHRASISQDVNAIERVNLTTQQAQTARNNFREQKGDDMANIAANGLESHPSLLYQKQQSASKLPVYHQQPIINSNKSDNMKPPTLPLGCLKLIKEKENALALKKEAANGNRGGSSRRSAYLSNTSKQ